MISFTEIAKAGVARITDFDEIEVWQSPPISKVALADPNARQEIVAALRLLEPIAAGTHVIVPKEPTEKMLFMASLATDDSPHKSYWYAAYRAMINAAQEETP